MYKATIFSTLAMAMILLSGCGAMVPSIAEPGGVTYPGVDDPKDPAPPVTPSGQLEYEIKQKVYCEIRTAVVDAEKYFVTTRVKHRSYRDQFLPDSWGAQIALSLEVDDAGSVNPGLSLITPFSNMQSRTLGFGASLSSTASRTDKFNSYFKIGLLRGPDALHGICEDPKKDPFVSEGYNPSRDSLMISNLGIKSWLLDAMFVNRSIPSFGVSSSNTAGLKSAAQQSSAKPPGPAGGAAPAPKKSADSPMGQQDAISIEIKFIVATTGNVNPSWKLVRVSADTGSSPLLSAGRTRTHDLILTIGPDSAATDNANLALQIGQAVSASNRAALVAP